MILYHKLDSDAASPRQIQTDNDASGNPQRVAGRPPLPSVRVTVLHLTGQKALGRPLRNRIQAMEVNAVCRLQKKCTANGLVCRGCPLTSQTAFGGQLPYKGSLARCEIWPYLFLYNGRFLRATNHEPLFFHEPRVTRGDVVILRLSPRSGI